MWQSQILLFIWKLQHTQSAKRKEGIKKEKEKGGRKGGEEKRFSQSSFPETWYIHFVSGYQNCSCVEWYFVIKAPSECPLACRWPRESPLDQTSCLIHFCMSSFNEFSSTTMICAGVALSCIRGLSPHFPLVNLLLFHPTHVFTGLLASSYIFQKLLFSCHIYYLALIAVCLLNAALLFPHLSVQYMPRS